jgi:hypothetical protein
VDAVTVFLKIVLWVYSSSPILVAIDSTNEQGNALRLHFEVVVAAVELPVARGKLKNRINTFLKNPLCRGVDELCTKQLESRCLLLAEMKAMKDAFMTSDSENLEYHRENIGLKEENDGLKKENDRPDTLLDYYGGKISNGGHVRAARECADALQRTPIATRRSGGHGDEL